MSNNRIYARNFGIVMFMAGTLMAIASAYIDNWLTWIVLAVGILLVMVGFVSIGTARKGSDEELARFTGGLSNKE